MARCCVLIKRRLHRQGNRTQAAVGEVELVAASAAEAAEVGITAHAVRSIGGHCPFTADDLAVYEVTAPTAHPRAEAAVTSWVLGFSSGAWQARQKARGSRRWAV